MEAEERIKLNKVTGATIEMPFDQSEEDWDDSYPTPDAWAGVLM